MPTAKAVPVAIQPDTGMATLIEAKPNTIGTGQKRLLLFIDKMAQAARLMPKRLKNSAMPPHNFMPYDR